MRTLVSVVAYWSWAIPRLRHYCHHCDLAMWGWQHCPHRAGGYCI
ncbi:hypothetical protein [Streptomyces sp. t39]|nr:hypothetical protein [Streptomyces sp. t39]